MRPGETRSLLEQLGIRPSKNLGQNFMIDANIARKSVAMAEIGPGERVVEIGPGLGALTRELLRAGAEVYAVEKDLRLCDHLEKTLRARFPDNLFLQRGDALEAPLAGLPSPDSADFKIVANLPYAISTPWLDRVLEGALPRRMVLMLQKEAADRFSASPGTKQFGAITVFLQSACERLRGHNVSRHCFYPEPDVDSTLLHLQRRENPFRFRPETKRLIRSCFGHRRKQIGSLVRKFGEDHDAEGWLAVLDEGGFSAKSRPEEIPPELWQRLKPKDITNL